MLNETDLYHASIYRNLARLWCWNKRRDVNFSFQTFFPSNEREQTRDVCAIKNLDSTFRKVLVEFCSFQKCVTKKVYSTAKKLEYRNSLNKFSPGSEHVTNQQRKSRNACRVLQTIQMNETYTFISLGRVDCFGQC